VVDVIEERISFDHRQELQSIPPGQIRRSIGEGVGALLVGHLERLAHPVSCSTYQLPRRVVESWRCATASAPSGGSRPVAARDERLRTLGNAPQRRDRVVHTAQRGRIARGPTMRKSLCITRRRLTK